MRKIIFQNMISLDGFFEGPNKELDWHNVDAEFNDIAIHFLNSIDLLIFGRVTYNLMANYWPTPAVLNDDPFVAERMNNLPKIVFSKSMKKAEWQNTRIANEVIPEEIIKLKQQPGKDIAIFGSSDLSLDFIKNGLIDEIRILVNPVILGSGKPLFKGINERLNLKLLNTVTYNSGNVALFYKPVQ